MPNRSVALVEDDHLVADMYRIGLEMHGFEVAVHRDGPSLFEALETATPDVVILDWNLPVMSGGQILDRLRLATQTRYLPVFILSDSPARHFPEGMISRLGVVGWLEKMTTPPALLADKVAAVFERVG